jgi:hypothetical protein
MIEYLLIVAMCYVIAGMLNGEMDYIKEHNLDSKSFLNKWYLVDGKEVKPLFAPWYYFGLHTPEYVEHFPYSSTILVFLTDHWHLAKWGMFLIGEIILSYFVVEKYQLNYWFIILGVIALKCFRGFGFNLIHKN